MGVSYGALGTGTVAAVVGVVLLGASVLLVASGPLFDAEHQQRSGFLGLGAGSSGSATFNAGPLLGLVLVLLGGVVLVVGLAGLMRSFDQGKARDDARGGPPS
jgi:hypothetical protein